MTSASGEDLSIGVAWRATMMANSSRDPYWQASVRRETIDHPRAAHEIEDECSTCHMPMSHTAARAAGTPASVFAHLPQAARPGAAQPDALSRLAQDGVSCTLCHQITPGNFGSPGSFSGGFTIDTKTPAEARPLFGPFTPDPALQKVMHSATGFRQTEGAHVRQSELCATCHTLYTTARDRAGQAVGRFPEQVPFQEWQHSIYVESASCQTCHMPAIAGEAPIASVLGQPRAGARKHSFVGGNFFVLAMLNRFRDALGVEALPAELEQASASTLAHLEESTARLTIDRAASDGRQLTVDVSIANLSGHKLPTAYPSRRAWIRLIVRDGSGRTVFSSGALRPSGAIEGNANDEQPAAFEPHYREIRRGDQVQIYESILADGAGAITTSLISALRYAKDNRLLPKGFDKHTAHADIAVHGDARDDADFTSGGDRVRYAVDLAGASAPFTVEAALLFQPIGFRWADNLRGYPADEPSRFVRYFDAMSSQSAAPLATASATVR
ncbi:MAG TPA: hypothetical protein VFK57_01980 [Vicinamibacterales bacterium]|nr:hypothetical protein [Vicinamibacterales bacterium]